MTELRDLADIDPFAPYRSLAGRGRVYWDDRMGAWVVPGYAECLHVARHEEQFETPWRDAAGGIDVLGRYGMYILRGTDHRIIHSALHKWFESASSARIVELVARQFDEVARANVPASGPSELVSALLEPLPGRIILEVMGLPVEEDLRLELVHLNEALHDWFAVFGDEPAVLERCLTAIAAAEDLLLPTIRARRDAPEDDLISAVWRIGSAQYPDWDERDVAKYATFFFGAGTINSTHLMASVAYTLLTRPDICERVTRDPDQLANLVEEVVRMWSPVQLRTRQAAEDVTLGGTEIRRGDRVHPVIGAANRDPSNFPKPDELDLARPKLRSHLGFYLGARYCAGAPLARIETVEFARLFLQRFSNARLDPGQPQPAFQGFSYRAFRPLHVLLNPSAM